MAHDFGPGIEHCFTKAYVLPGLIFETLNLNFVFQFVVLKLIFIWKLSPLALSVIRVYSLAGFREVVRYC